MAADKIVDPVVVKFTKTVNNLGMYAGFLVNFAQRRLLFGLAIFDVTFRKSDMAGNVGDENVFAFALILGIKHRATALFVIADKLCRILGNELFCEPCDIRFIKNAVFACGNENIVLFAGFVVRKGDDLGVELVDREVFADEDYFLYAVFAERGLAEIEKTGKASFQKRAVGFFTLTVQVSPKTCRA